MANQKSTPTPTSKQEAFSRFYVETGSAIEAYIKAGYSQDMKRATMRRKASEVLDKPVVTALVTALQRHHQQRLQEQHDMTIDELLAEMEENRKTALEHETPQCSAAVNATMGKARMLGYLTQKVDHTSSDGSFSNMDHKDAADLLKSKIEELKG